MGSSLINVVVLKIITLTEYHFYRVDRNKAQMKVHRTLDCLVLSVEN